ncbi:OmpP1/FadL family transporter [Ostreiculturibacter nitratireducens]|uniref:OmpP1/FadL family transporter n=1 Tax=Ostreiculturibacter nitratireducens TaxID=3075226 RepID=UPI0031B5C7C6
MLRRTTCEGALKAALAFTVAGIATPAMATEGYFALGYGPVQRGTAGAGVAAPAGDAMASALNPAAVAGLGRELSMGIELFAPDRGYEATGTTMVAPGSYRSGHRVFPIPNFAYNLPLSNGHVLNFAAYGNGGMNTSYSDPIFGEAPAGVDLAQLFLSATYAGETNGISWGIAPTLAIQSFQARGLGAFAGMSVDPTALSNNGHDLSWGVGLRAGIQAEIAPGVRAGISGQTKFNMTKFDKYAGLFEGGGDFDIPASITAGLAFDPRPDTTVMFDYQRIFYSGVPAVSNATDAGPLGAPDGAGFGWDDVDVLKIGVEWRKSPQMTWRFGYAYATNPIGAEDVLLNVIAPGVVQHHFTAGGSWQLNARDRIDFAAVYALNNSVTGAVPPGEVTIDMDQIELAVGWTRRF